jgi:hypothetical protein
MNYIVPISISVTAFVMYKYNKIASIKSNFILNNIVYLENGFDYLYCEPSYIIEQKFNNKIPNIDYVCDIEYIQNDSVENTKVHDIIMDDYDDYNYNDDDIQQNNNNNIVNNINENNNEDKSINTEIMVAINIKVKSCIPMCDKIIINNKIPSNIIWDPENILNVDLSKINKKYIYMLGYMKDYKYYYHSIGTDKNKLVKYYINQKLYRNKLKSFFKNIF